MLLRDEQTANIVLENTGVCCVHTENSHMHARTHAHTQTQTAISARSVSFLKVKKSHHQKTPHCFKSASSRNRWTNEL